jgi:palmitoyltransferase ZDHHC9/14/18
MAIEDSLVADPDVWLSETRVVLVWRQRFLCGGRLIFGPDASSIVLTVALIMTPLALFVAFVSFRLAEVIGKPLGAAVPATAVAVGVFVSP